MFVQFTPPDRRLGAGLRTSSVSDITTLALLSSGPVLQDDANDTLIGQEVFYDVALTV